MPRMSSATIAALPLVAGLIRGIGGLDWLDQTVQVVLGVVLFLGFGLLSYLLLQGAATARHRAHLLLDGPLRALWETLGARRQATRGRRHDDRGGGDRDDAARLVRRARAHRARVQPLLERRDSGTIREWPRPSCPRRPPCP